MTYSVLLPSASRTTTQTLDLLVGDEKGLIALLNMSTVGTGSVTLTINGLDQVSNTTWLILAGAAVTTNTVNVYKIYPGLTAAANLTASDVVPDRLRFVVTANNANAATYSLSINTLP